MTIVVGWILMENSNSNSNSWNLNSDCKKVTQKVTEWFTCGRKLKNSNFFSLHNQLQGCKGHQTEQHLLPFHESF